MSLDFLLPLQALYGDFLEGNSSAPTQACEAVIPHDKLYQYLLIPAIITTAVLAFAEKRVNTCLQCLSGSPGVVYPMDIMGRSNRFSFAAAFGATASLCASVIFYQRFAIQLGGPSFVKVFATLLSMLIYGMDYMPLFTALTANSTLGYAIATLYAWAFTAITFIRNYFCDEIDLNGIEYLIITIRGLPELLCHLYLSISCPIRFVRSLWRRRKFQQLAVDFEDDEDIFESIKRSYQGIHVVKLFKPSPSPPEPANGIKEKIKSALKGIYHKVIYKKLDNFRYSTRMVSVTVVSLILIYQAYVELIVVIVAYARILIKIIKALMDETSGGEYQLLEFVLYIINALYACLVTSLTIGFLLGVIMIIHTLASYRTLLLGLYKGNSGHLTPKEEKSNSTLLVGSMRYAGYQVAYVAWGYAIQFVVLFLVSIVLATIIIMIIFGIHDWLLTILNNVWPVLLTSLVVNISQKLMATFAFLQESGNLLALNNRRVFFVVAYFMFFYNIFLGLVSCLLRILKAMILGTLFLPRLDHSTLPRKFQWFDPGFDAFCGFMHIENAHTNPVVLTFISLVHAEILEKKRAEEDGNLATTENGTAMKRQKRQINTVARFQWKLAYTLIKNPQLFIQKRCHDANIQTKRNRSRRSKYNCNC